MKMAKILMTVRERESYTLVNKSGAILASQKSSNKVNISNIKIIKDSFINYTISV